MEKINYSINYSIYINWDNIYDKESNEEHSLNLTETINSRDVIKGDSIELESEFSEINCIKDSGLVIKREKDKVNVECTGVTEILYNSFILDSRKQIHDSGNIDSDKFSITINLRKI